MKHQFTQSNPALPGHLGGGGSRISYGLLSVFWLMALMISAGQSLADVRVQSSQFSVSPTLTSIKADELLYATWSEDGQRIGDAELIHTLVRIHNTAGTEVQLAPIGIYLGAELRPDQDPRGGFGASFYAFLDGFVVDAAAGVAERFNAAPEELTGTAGSWLGWTNRYQFEAVRLVDFSADWRAIPGSGQPDGDVIGPDRLYIQPDIADLVLRPGEQVVLKFDYLAGSKSRQLLADEKINLQDLLLTNLWQWLRSISFVIWALLDYLVLLCGSWGIGIIALALVIRVVTIPVTRYALRHQKNAIRQQAEIAPLLAEVKRQYEGATQSEKIIALYESHHYDQLAPFKSMAGLLIQIPIFVALFNVLGEAVELREQSFLWIEDLARSDRLFDWGVDLPYFGSYLNLLPVIMAAVTILSTWLASRQAGNEDAPTLTLFGMGGLFFFLFYSFPAALVLYWLSSNFFQLIQQSFENLLVGKKP